MTIDAGSNEHAANVTIRPAGPADVEALVGLLQELFAIEHDFCFDPDKHRQGLQCLLANVDGCCVLVAERQAEVVGMVTAQVVISTAEGGAVGWVEDLVVRYDCRGQGIGRKLLASIETWAERKGLTRLQLLADRDNRPALRFYDDAGWERTRLIGLRRSLF